MPISMKKYVDIKSGINNIRTATEKELIARIFVNNSRLNPKELYEFENSAEVSNFFGNDSVEYEIAKRYFGYINKYSRSPKKISYYRDWREGINALFFSYEDITLATVKAITDGELKISINDVEKTLSSLDFSSATDMSDVASILQTAIRGAGSEGENMYLNATVEAFDDRLMLTSGVKDYGTIFIVEESTVADALQFHVDEDGFIGRPEGTAKQVFDESYEVSNNFATYTFIGMNNADDIADLANDVNEDYPSEFMTIVSVTENNAETIQSAVSNINGVSLELCNNDEARYNFVLPMAITATTDYNKENGTVNYMYNQDENMEVIVDNDNSAERFDELKVNYYGRTQQAGQKLAFYQNGVLQGNYQDQNIYVNEIWLKDALTTKFLNYMLLTSNWYANKAGQAIGQGLIVDIIERAKLNGTITTEKEISENDKVYIYKVTADENAWRQIYELGYYLITSISKVTINNQETYQFNYTLLYSKGDSIKKVEGQNILI